MKGVVIPLALKWILFIIVIGLLLMLAWPIISRVLGSSPSTVADIIKIFH